MSLDLLAISWCLWVSSHVGSLSRIPFSSALRLAVVLTHNTPCRTCLKPNSTLNAADWPLKPMSLSGSYLLARKKALQPTTCDSFSLGASARNQRKVNNWRRTSFKRPARTSEANPSLGLGSRLQSSAARAVRFEDFIPYFLQHLYEKCKWPCCTVTTVSHCDSQLVGVVPQHQSIFKACTSLCQETQTFTLTRVAGDPVNLPWGLATI